jgi:hypothetical protein
VLADHQVEERPAHVAQADQGDPYCASHGMFTLSGQMG